MGLDTTHNCWHGPYSAFARWRRKVAEVAGYGELDEYEGFDGRRSWPVNGDVLLILLQHSDCDGEIAANDCAPLADRLEQLLPALTIADRLGNYRDDTVQFINGLRDAAALGENVLFR